MAQTASAQTVSYKTLCNVLDSLRSEAPASLKIYHPNPTHGDAVIQARSRALLHLFLKAKFGLVDFDDREQRVTDGSADGGIDAYFIDGQRKDIYLLQSKFRASAGGFASSNMSAADLLRMDVKRILTGEKKSEDDKPYNERIRKGLQRAIAALPDPASYTPKVILLGNAKFFTPSEVQKLVHGYTVDQYDHSRVYKELLFPVVNGSYYTSPDLTIQINLDNVRHNAGRLDYDVKAGSLKANVKLVFVPTAEIGRVMYTYKNSILKYNPRSFLELSRNPVNQEIQRSVTSSKSSNEFALFNNGITIFSDKTKFGDETGQQGVAQIVLLNPQLVNGGQTAYTLSRLYERDVVGKNDYSHFKGKEVLMKVITFIGSNSKKDEKVRNRLVTDVSEATNRQTRIDEADRRSNDPLQHQLQEAFFERHGLYYERKRGEFADGINQAYIKPDVVLNRERILRIALACEYKANWARSSIQKFFKASMLPSILKVTEVDRYAYGHEVFELLEAKRRKRVPGHDRYKTRLFGQALRYGQYAIVAVAVNRGFGKVAPAAAVDAVLASWRKFETWARKRPSNSGYKITGRAFDFQNYYKGATIDADIKGYTFKVQ